jgi:flagellar protein FlbT
VLPIYTKLTRDALRAAPSMLEIVERMNNCVLTGALYKAFREARSLVAYEKSIFEHAARGERLRTDGANDGEPA